MTTCKHCHEKIYESMWTDSRGNWHKQWLHSRTGNAKCLIPGTPWATPC